MLRYFYLLCLLVCIDWSFCYEYIPGNRPLRLKAREHKNRPLRLKAREQSVKRQKHRERRFKDFKKEYDMEDKNSVAHIDVASFIQQPDYDVLENSYQQLKDARRRHSKLKHYENLVHFDSPRNHDMPIHHRKRERKHNEHSQSKNGRPSNLENSNAPQNGLHSQKKLRQTEKKCTSKSISFPFFSHKKYATQKEKKKCKKKKFTPPATTVLISPILTSSSPKPSRPNSLLYNSLVFPSFKDNIMKRSYEQRLCPQCKRRFVAKRSKLKTRKKTRVIHNSRQFYKQAERETKHKANYYQCKVTDQERDEVPRKKRRKREKETDEIEKRLEEINKVEQNVDTTKVKSDQPQQQQINISKG